VRRLGALDATLLAVLVPAWIVAFALHVTQYARARLGWVGVYVAAPSVAADPPIVRDFWPDVALRSDGLQVGDRLLRVGTADLHGVGAFGFAVRAWAQAGPGPSAVVEYERDGRRAETALPFVPIAFPWRMMPLVVGFVLAGTLVIVRLPGIRAARAFFYATIAYSFHWTFFFGGTQLQTWAWLAVFFVSSALAFPLWLRVPQLFPPEIVPPGGRLARWPWMFLLFGPIVLGFTTGMPIPPSIALPGAFATNVAFLVALFAVLGRNYLRATPVGRRQIKWAVLGIYVGTAPVLAADVVTAFRPHLYWLHDAAVVFEILIPACMLIALVRYNLFDVDRLITSTAAYSALLIFAGAALLAGVPRAAHAMSTTTAVDQGTAQLVLSLVVAAAVLPAARAVRPLVERLFFADRHALVSGVDALLRDLSTADDPAALLAGTAERLDALLRPQTLVLYGGGDPPVPILARGIEVEACPMLPADGQVLATLRSRRAPLDVGGLPEVARSLLAPGDRAAIAGLHAAVLLPLLRGGELAGVLSIGNKRSGDIYTATDLTLLAAVADKVAGELQRFDLSEIVQKERAMRESLGRYVPAPVAARLAAGREVEGGEREITVLFVDIRGYTTYSEGRDTERVFSIVNRYTEHVSDVVRQHGGTVVEFLGDGVMAVFGAPDPLPGHARAAVSAAHGIVETVARLDLGGDDGEAPIAVGVGLATGRAFVGNIRAADRLIYTAVGDTVNLASRIQGLTRELRASVAIDDATHAAAGDAAAAFTAHPGARIRGRAEPVDLWLLPLAEPRLSPASKSS
jgi:class 3 adenylate cyclase